VLSSYVFPEEWYYMDKSGTRRIALRLTPQEDDEINDFLSTTLKYKTKSEFIRAAIYEFIKKPARKEEIQKTEPQYNLSRASLKLIDQLVLKGIARDRDDAIEKIIQAANYEKVLTQWIVRQERGYFDSFNTMGMNNLFDPQEEKKKHEGEDDE
jgi:Arc/MetJ-type ribon-helix-helix transcriptional regulator